MRLWEGIPRDSCHQRGKPYIFLLPRFCMKSKCNMYIHIPSSPSPHFSLQAPEAPPKWRRLSWDTSSPPHAEAPCGSHSCPLTGWVPRSGARMERAAGGAHGLPQLPARGDSASSVWQRICGDSGRGKKRAGLDVCV